MTETATQRQNGSAAGSSYRDSLKSMDTEEHIDLYFYRRIGYAWAVAARKLGVTPNAITIASIFLGLGAGVMFYFSNIWLNIVGMLLLIWANSFDSADGQLARMTHQYSRLGRILDGLSGDIWFAAIYVAICLRENVTSEFFMTHQWVIWVVAVVTGICHAKQAAMADYYRNIHLLFLKGKAGSELSHSPALKENYKKMSWKKDFIYKLFETFYINYTVGQERLTPKFQRMMQIIRQDYHDQAPEWFRTAFREKSLPLMKYTNMLSFNTRVIALFVSLFIDMPWLYFTFEIIVLNAMLVYMIKRHEHICQGFTQELKERCQTNS